MWQVTFQVPSFSATDQGGAVVVLSERLSLLLVNTNP